MTGPNRDPRQRMPVLTLEAELTAAAFDRCGARRYRDEAERELRRLGVRISRRTGRLGGTGARGRPRSDSVALWV